MYDRPLRKKVSVYSNLILFPAHGLVRLAILSLYKAITGNNFKLWVAKLKWEIL